MLSKDILKVGATGFSVINTSISIGALIGVLLIFVNVFKDKYKMVIIGLSIEGVSLLLLGLMTLYPIAITSALILGLGVTLAGVGIGTLYQTIIPKDKMGRVMGLVSTLLQVVTPIGTLFGSFTVLYLPLEMILSISGVIVTLSGLSLIFLLKNATNKTIRNEGKVEALQ